MTLKKHMLKNQKGMTLIEMVLAMTGMAILALVAAMIIAPWSKTYTTISNRTTSQDDARYAFDRMCQEIQGIKQGNLTGATNTQLSFVDNAGNATNFHLSGNSLYRGSDKLLENVDSFQFIYFDASSASTSTASSVRRVVITASISSPGGEGAALNLRTGVYLRNYLYENYQ